MIDKSIRPFLCITPQIIALDEMGMLINICFLFLHKNHSH